jgi:AcrR family transcriptional regulator
LFDTEHGAKFVRNLEGKMAKNEQDRRVQKTRHALQEAFIDLILEKGYNAVMLQDILDRANVGRSTFYAHYRDKEDLLANCFQGLHDVFEGHAQFAQARSMTGEPPSGTPIIFLPTVLAYVQNEHRLFKALLGKRSGGPQVREVQDFMLKYARGMVKTITRASLPAYQVEATAQYLSNTLLVMLIWWVDNDLPCSAEELYTLMLRLIEPGLKNVLQMESLWPFSAK